MKITQCTSNYVKEPLLSPFGFKGGYLSELWQIVVKVTDEAGNFGVGVGVQSVLWSDSEIFTTRSEYEGNRQMLLVTEYALKLLCDTEFKNPIDSMDMIEDRVFEYAKVATGNPTLRKTFIKNALVSVDNALWQLYAKEMGTKDFLKLVGSVDKKYTSALSKKNDKVTNIPLISYGVSIDSVKDLANKDYSLLKIKIGSNPDGDGDLSKMLEWDKMRLKAIHDAVKDIYTPYTKSGHIMYYLDANGRYDTKSRFAEFIDFAHKIGAQDRIAILEEPFPETFTENVSDLGMNIAADESAHSAEDARAKIEQGFGSIALKPIAKTISETLKILSDAHSANIPCFIADLTVNPLMVSINKNFAARMQMFPGMKVAMLESNGMQNYVNWEKMKTYTPNFALGKAPLPDLGIYDIEEDLFTTSDGIFDNSPYYTEVANGK